MRPLAVRIGVATLLTALLYVVVGELVQGWAGLHFDAWQTRVVFGNERDRVEWERVEDGLQAACLYWPWKTSFHRDYARLQLFGVRGGFVEEKEAARVILAAVGRAAESSVENGEDLLLATKAHLLSDDVAGFRVTTRRLRAVAPHDRVYWQPLVVLTAERALGAPDWQLPAREVTAYYASWDEQQLMEISRRVVAVRTFLPSVR